MLVRGVRGGAAAGVEGVGACMVVMMRNSPNWVLA